jgi:zinc finger protein 830
MSKRAEQKRVESPLAKYNGAGQLFCALCAAPVKNEMFWTGHLNGEE